MRKLLLTLLLVLPLSALARLPVPVIDAEQWRVQGAGEMRWFGFAIYDARLWRSGTSWNASSPYALELKYRRTISTEQLVDTSMDEIARLGEKDTARLRVWRTELQKVFPPVRDGDVIIGLHEPGRGAQFFYNGTLTGAISDARLAAAFFSIWLDPRTKAPALRSSLLGSADGQPY